MTQHRNTGLAALTGERSLSPLVIDKDRAAPDHSFTRGHSVEDLDAILLLEADLDRAACEQERLALTRRKRIRLRG
jgi:hypothetical protein